MKDDTPTGGPAFPHDDRAVYNDRSGMTLRDYFAAKAMQSLVTIDFAANRGHDGPDAVAFGAYAMADAMLKARSK